MSNLYWLRANQCFSMPVGHISNASIPVWQDQKGDSPSETLLFPTTSFAARAMAKP